MPPKKQNNANGDRHMVIAIYNNIHSMGVTKIDFWWKYPLRYNPVKYIDHMDSLGGESVFRRMQGQMNKRN